MKISSAKRKLIENEMIFRRINEKLEYNIDVLDQMHIDDGNPQLIHDDLPLIEFRCECADENCEARIPLRLSKYREIHSNREDFIVKTNHQVDEIEKVVQKEKGYNIVRKNHLVAEPGNTLNRTPVDNTSNN